MNETNKPASTGLNVVIEENVTFGKNVTVGHNVVIKEGTIIGDNVTIGDMTVVGKRPSSNRKMARKPPAALPPLVLGTSVTIGCGSVLYRGSTLGEGVFVADLSSIRENVTVDTDSIIGRNVIVENNTRIGKRVTVQTGCYVTADMIIEDEVFIGPCCSSSNDKYMGAGNFSHTGPIIKKGAKIGNNTTMLPAVTIGENAIVGAGAVIVKDVPAGTTVVGNPARQIRP
ncbi:DapH/DapD/GlmU-related protein [Alteribacter lacisalsi]|nr:DapH/DapD/GlmU-related protein [Alteribacter lacisalsi]